MLPQLFLPKAFIEARNMNRNGVDPRDYLKSIAFVGPLARASSKEKRAAHAGTFVVQNKGPNRQQRMAMRASQRKDKKVGGDYGHR